MPLMPKRTKYRKPHRLTYDGKAKGNLTLQFGDFGLQAKEGGYVTAKQIEAEHVSNISATDIVYLYDLSTSTVSAQVKVYGKAVSGTEKAWKKQF